MWIFGGELEPGIVNLVGCIGWLPDMSQGQNSFKRDHVEIIWDPNTGLLGYIPSRGYSSYMVAKQE